MSSISMVLLKENRRPCLIGSFDCWWIIMTCRSDLSGREKMIWRFGITGVLSTQLLMITTDWERGLAIELSGWERSLIMIRRVLGEGKAWRQKQIREWLRSSERLDVINS